MYPKREATTSKLESNSINYFSARRYSLDGLKKIVGSVNRLRQSESEDMRLSNLRWKSSNSPDFTEIMKYIHDILPCALTQHPRNKEEGNHNQPGRLLRGCTLIPGEHPRSPCINDIQGWHGPPVLQGARMPEVPLPPCFKERRICEASLRASREGPEIHMQWLLIFIRGQAAGIRIWKAHPRWSQKKGCLCKAQVIPEESSGHVHGIPRRRDITWNSEAVCTRYPAWGRKAMHTRKCGNTWGNTAGIMGTVVSKASSI